MSACVIKSPYNNSLFASERIFFSVTMFCLHASFLLPILNLDKAPTLKELSTPKTVTQQLIVENGQNISRIDTVHELSKDIKIRVL